MNKAFLVPAFLCTKLFFLTYALLQCFFSSLLTSPSWNVIICSLSFFCTPLLLSETSLSPLQGTLTRFVLSGSFAFQPFPHYKCGIFVKVYTISTRNESRKAHSLSARTGCSEILIAISFLSIKYYLIEADPNKSIGTGSQLSV